MARGLFIRRLLLRVVERLLGLAPVVGRAWLTTDRRPPNHEQYALQTPDDLVLLVNFDGPTLEGDLAKLHQLLDILVAKMRDEFRRRPDLNVWRIGELRIRCRAGRAETAMEYAMLGRTPDGVLVPDL